MAIAPLGHYGGTVIPYQVGPEFEDSYHAVDDEMAVALDDGLETLLGGLHATAGGRRHRVTGDEGGAYIFQIPTDGGVWHVYWDYATPDRDEIRLIDLVLIEV